VAVVFAQALFDARKELGVPDLRALDVEELLSLRVNLLPDFLKARETTPAAVG
jgi:hypothetical protein